MAKTRTPNRYEEHPVLSSYIPSKGVHQTYHQRELTDEHKDLALLRYFHDQQSNVLLVGPTGSGKTAALAAYAAKHRLPFIQVPSHGAATPDQFFGRFVPTTAGELRWVWGPVAIAVRDGGVLYLDEPNYMAPRILGAMNSLLDWRRSLILMDHPVTAICEEHGNLHGSTEHLLVHPECESKVVPFEGPLVIPAHDDLFICGAYNPGYEGTRPMNPAFLDRWVQLAFDYDEDAEANLVSSTTLLEFGHYVRKEFEAGNIRTPLSTRRLVEFDQQVDGIGYETSKEVFLWGFPEAERPVIRNILEDRFEDRVMADYGYEWVMEDLDDDLDGAEASAKATRI